MPFSNIRDLNTVYLSQTAQSKTDDCLTDLLDLNFDIGKVKSEPLDSDYFVESVLEHHPNFAKHEHEMGDSFWGFDVSSLSDYKHSQPIVNNISHFTQSGIHRPYIGNKHKPSKVLAKSTMTEVQQLPRDTTTPSRKRESKRAARTSKAAPYTTVPLPPCKVCGGCATGFHFGVITCEACKAFFRRALIHKQAYKCLKDDDCEIIDKKLGNCSACRLKKCFTLGMSKGGVRRGRYSIAIRTKAIVEAKALEGKDAEPMIPNKKQKLDIFSDISSLSQHAMSPDSDSGISMDAFDGLLEISEMDENFNLTVTMHNAPPTFIQNSELDFLIDALISCQEAVYPNLKKQLISSFEATHNKVYEELTVKQELFSDLFGKTETISTEEYQQIFAETGIDLDDRLVNFNKKGKQMEDEIAQFVNYAKIIPGFKNLNPKDVSRLLKAAHMEFWVFGNFPLLNRRLGTYSNWDGSYCSNRDQMIKFFGGEWIDEVLNFSESLKRLDCTPEEIAIIRVIILTYTDRCSLIDVEKIQSLQEKMTECLQYHLQKTVSNPTERLYKIFDRLLAIRDLSNLNRSVNKKFLSDWAFVMHDFPLWKEMLSFDEI